MPFAKLVHKQKAPSASGEETDGALLCTSFQLLVEAFGEMRCVFYSSGNLCKYSRTDGPIGVMPNTLPYCPTFVSVLSNPASAWQESRRNFWSDSDE